MNPSWPSHRLEYELNRWLWCLIAQSAIPAIRYALIVFIYFFSLFCNFDHDELGCSPKVSLRRAPPPPHTHSLGNLIKLYYFPLLQVNLAQYTLVKIKRGCILLGSASCGLIHMFITVARPDNISVHNQSTDHDFLSVYL
jgi:hypothetical protein